jgi:hypothetical protein
MQKIWAIDATAEAVQRKLGMRQRIAPRVGEIGGAAWVERHKGVKLR